uniref:Uncharacterized protein n=1 Tax=Anguilla anguilla TaxID=7936 RepID=A0A0E9VVH0_ANGAN
MISFALWSVIVLSTRSAQVSLLYSQL